MPKALINGTEIHYRDVGEGYPIFFLHGYTGNLRNWALQIPALRRQFRCVSIDHRGHGQSAKPTRPEDYSLEALAEDANGLLEHLGIGECYVVGHSMGGVISQRLTLAHPERVRALALVDTWADMPDGARTQERMRLLEIARDEGMEAVFEEQLAANPLVDQIRAQPDLLEKWREQFLMTSREAYIYLAQQMAESQPLLDRLPSIELPALVVCGEYDFPFLGPCRRIEERIPGSELVIIAGAAHTPQIEKAAEFNRVLMGFLSRVHQGAAAARTGERPVAG